VRVIVLPFDNMTGDPGQDPFCDALAAETSATLGTLGAARPAGRREVDRLTRALGPMVRRRVRGAHGAWL
jgi:hypothetical protein